MSSELRYSIKNFRAKKNIGFKHYNAPYSKYHRSLMKNKDFSPLEHYLIAYKNYFRSEGRSSRADFVWYFIFTFSITVLLVILDIYLDLNIISFNKNESYGVLTIIYAIFNIVPSIVTSVRRLHDMGHSGGWWFANLIPLGGFILLMFQLFTPSQKGTNRWGINLNDD